MGQMGSAPFASTRRRRRDGGAFSPLALYANGEAGGWYDPSDLTPEKVSWRRNLLTYSEQFDNSAWTKSNASILSNLVLWSEQFDNAAWTKTNTTITANNAVAPDGTNTADQLIENTANAQHFCGQAPSLGAGAHTFSVYYKLAAGTRFLALYHAGANVGRQFDGSGNSSAGLFNAPTAFSVTAVGNGWYRASITATISAGASEWRLWLADASNALSYTGDGASGYFLWGAQLVPGTTAQTYTPTTSAAAPIPFTAPDGSATADKLVSAASTSQQRISFDAQATFAADTYTLSVYAKAAEWGFIGLTLFDGTYRGAIFSLTDGSTSFVQAGTTTTATSLANGWWRLSITATTTGTLSTAANASGFWARPSIPTINIQQSVTGDGSSGVLTFGAQLERGTVASSYQRITDFTSDFLAAFPQHALYQDSAGTTPVTALGQPVGLVLDKSKGGLANLGPELVTNGDFSSGTTGWTISGAWAVVSGQFVKTGGSNATAQQTILTIGRTYLIELDVIAVSGALLVYAGSGVAATISTTGRRRAILTCSGDTNLYLQCLSASTATIDNITVREVPGAHAIQATSASRPTCDARVNLLTYSEQLNNAVWSTQGGATVSANTQTAPDGTATADTVNLTTTSNSAVFQLDTVAKNQAGTHTLSVWVRVASGTAQFQMASYSPTDNVAYSSTFTATTTWQRFSWTRTVTVATNWYPVLNDGTLPAATFFVWGVQLETGSTATTYQRVVTASDYADVQAPRYLTFDGIDDSLYTAASVDFATWTSGTRRNLLTYPSAFDNSAWTKVSASVTANNVVAPDGTTTGDTVAATATGVGARIQQDNTVAATGQYVYSCYLRRDNVNTAVLRIFNNTSSTNLAEVTFNVQNGTVSSTVVGSGTITNVGNGWYRCEVTHTGSVTGGNSIRVYVYPNNTSPTSGDAVATWGAQLELGSTATAFQDVGTDKMTVVTGVRKLSDAAAGIIAELSSDYNANNGAFLQVASSSAGQNYLIANKGTVGQSSGLTTFAAPITNVTALLADISGDSLIGRVNAVQISSNTGDQGTGTYGTYVLFIGRRNNASLPFNGRLYQLIVRGAQTDTATVQQTERFVAGKTGVTL